MRDALVIVGFLLGLLS